ncbi:hypothetical protein [Sinorhizobium sp. Sb3]|nr:hypothetical protein [Sinorhizobium sp. Sb3]
MLHILEKIDAAGATFRSLTEAIIPRDPRAHNDANAWFLCRI